MQKRVLLDTHIVISLARSEFPEKYPQVAMLMASDDVETCASVVSLWEIAIKHRLGKLEPVLPLLALPAMLDTYAISLIDIGRYHALVSAVPEPPTRDPFDRLLLAQCQVEDMRLVTLDRALSTHPLAWRNEKPAPVPGSGPS